MEPICAIKYRELLVSHTPLEELSVRMAAMAARGVDAHPFITNDILYEPRHAIARYAMTVNGRYVEKQDRYSSSQEKEATAAYQNGGGVWTLDPFLTPDEIHSDPAAIALQKLAQFRFEVVRLNTMNRLQRSIAVAKYVLMGGGIDQPPEDY